MRIFAPEIHSHYSQFKISQHSSISGIEVSLVFYDSRKPFDSVPHLATSLAQTSFDVI